MASRPPRQSSVLGSSVDVKAGQVDVSLKLRQPSDADPPIAKTAQLTLPKGIEWKGGDTPSCDAETLKGGVDTCPPASIIGNGEAIGLTDQSETVGQITAVNGGEGRCLSRDGRPQPGLREDRRARDNIFWEPDDGLKLDFTFPKALQTIAGVPVGLQELKLTIKRGPWLVVPDCPDDAPE